MDDARDWTWLCDGIIDSVLTYLVSMQDYIRFGCVCKRWHFVAERQKRNRVANCNKQVPLLLVPKQDRSEKSRGLYNPFEDKLLDAELEIPYHRRCCGSSHGWLAFIEIDYGVTLYNPFTRAEISLPPVGDTSGINKKHRRKYSAAFAKKVILSADPSLHPDEYGVAALIDRPFRSLAIMRPGKDEKWTHFTSWSNYTGRFLLHMDIIFDKSGKWIYGTGNEGMVARASVDRAVEEPPRLEMIVKSWGPPATLVQEYLVTSSNGDLLMIVRFYHDLENDELVVTTRDIQVFKLKDSKFIRVEDLNGDAVFIGDNVSTAIPSSDLQGMEGDCIYYTDDFIECYPHQYKRFGARDIGKFNVKDRKFASHYVPSSMARTRDMPPPIWIFPSLKWS